MQQDCHDFGDEGFQGIWSFGQSASGVWLAGYFRGGPTRQGLEILTAEEIYEFQHRPFLEKVSGVRTGGTDDPLIYLDVSRAWAYVDQPEEIPRENAQLIKANEVLYIVEQQPDGSYNFDGAQPVYLGENQVEYLKAN